MDLSDDEVRQRAEADRREVDPPIQVENFLSHGPVSRIPFPSWRHTMANYFADVGDPGVQRTVDESQPVH